MADPKDFELHNIQWRTQRSREIGGSGQLIRTGVNEAMVNCRKCGEVWRATEGHRDGQFHQGIGGLHVTCPSCKANGTAPLPA